MSLLNIKSLGPALFRMPFPCIFRIAPVNGKPNRDYDVEGVLLHQLSLAPFNVLSGLNG